MKIHVVLAGAALVAACAQQNNVPPVTTTSAPVVTASDPIVRLARQRCAHEAVCGGLGAGKLYATEAECTTATEKEERAVLDRSCPNGVDQNQVGRCLLSMQARYCKDAIRSLDDVADCRNAELCAPPANP